MNFLLIAISFITILCYSFDVISPIWFSMMMSCSLITLLFARNSLYNNFLSIYFIILYTLPFIHGFEYIGFDFERSVRPQVMWGLLTNDYTFSEPILSRMLMMSSIGLLAMILGIFLVNTLASTKPDNHRPSIASYQGQSMPGFFMLLGLAFLLSWLNSPKDSILSHSYGSSVVSPNTFNFNASWMLSYIMLVALFIDQEFMSNSKAHLLLKRISLFGAVLVIVVSHQFMRGDRECMTLLAAFAILFAIKSFKAMQSSSNMRRALFRKTMSLMIFAGLLFLAANVVGSLRSILSLNLSTEELSQQIHNALAQVYAGTWSAVLLTPLSVTGDFYLGHMDFRMGATYVDTLLSLIPSPMARFMDYTRPIEGTHGPAWEMRFGIGGTHVLVVPYMNFGILGVYFSMFLQGALFAWIDNAVRHNNNFSKIFLFGSLIVIGPHWYWYGDMSLVRGVMAYAITWLMYCFLALKAPRPQVQQLS